MSCPPRYATPRTSDRETLGTAAANIADVLGTPLLPWQSQVLDTALELDPVTGRLAYREVILTVPRQSGKTTLLLVLILLRALGAPRQNIRYTAQTGGDARKKLVDDWLPVLSASRFGALFTPRLTNGNEALRFKNRSLVGLVATTRRAGHGGTLDLGIVDEAFAQPDARLEQALKPSMMTRPQPQLWIVSTAGTPADSAYLLDKVKTGREAAAAGITHSVAYFEWAADGTADPADRATWRTAMPALGLTVTEEAVAADFASMDVSEFRRAYLNQWTATLSEPVISPETWNALADPRSEAVDPVALAFDISPDRSTSTIAAAGYRRDGLRHVEVVETAPATNWVARRLAALVERHSVSTVVCDQVGAGASLIPELERLGVTVTTTSAAEMAVACGLFYDAVTGTPAQLRHLGTPDLAAAIEGATKRELSGAWAWNRRNSGADITSLVAATLANWAVETKGEPGGLVWDLKETQAYRDFLAGRLIAEDDGEGDEHAQPPGTVRFIPLEDFHFRGVR